MEKEKEKEYYDGSKKEEKTEMVTLSEAITVIGVIWAIAWVFVTLINEAG
ncbi:hypothetical protein LCGC14_1088450 [marine sediment metagenome]|uniref:Uncharacterized protein n=1 Tax=marine sediment metagenome TaxID=412755 RepID=A0A0F9MHK6_9ZZZZ